MSNLRNVGDDGVSSEPDHPGSGAEVVAALLSQDFTAATVAALRRRLRVVVTAAGLTGDVGYDFVLAVHELVTNAVRHGGGQGHLELRREHDVLICEVTDHGEAAGNLPVRPPAVDVAGGRGLWLAHQLTEGLLLTRRHHGVTATVTACLEPSNGPHAPSTASGAPPDDEHGRPRVDDQG